MNPKRLPLLIVFLFLLAGCNREPTIVDVSGNPDIDVAEESAMATPQGTRTTGGSTTIVADGQLVVVNPALPLSFQSGGRLLTIDVKAGDQVATGDLIATLEDDLLREAVTEAELAVAQAENGLAQSQLTLDDLLTWEPDDLAISLAEANLAAAEADYEKALSQDAVAGNNLTSARVNLEQAERALADAQEAYDIAWQEARDWELNYDKPICLPGQGGPIPCTGITWKERLENERDATTRAVQQMEDNLTVAQANYRLTQAGLNQDSALTAEAAVASAQQALNQAQSGPEENEIAAARLQVEQAEISLQQAEYNLDQARLALEDAKLIAPWSGIVLSVDAAPGAFVSGGTPIITLLDSKSLQFHTSNLSERDLAYVEPGQQTEITLKTYPNQPLAGEVSYIVPQASGQVGDAATFTVVVDLDESELELKSGMTGRIEILRQEE
ncbi:MAG: efflux RND transporter periplasmic adaptor subunit [Chloroflexota bacterium]|jgi:multidrug resistance efflux pump